MKNRSVEFFNLSFLDLLSGALAAIIFLFIIVPKGNLTLYSEPVTVVYDTIQNKFYGSIPGDFAEAASGDTLLAIIGGLEGVPVAMQEQEESAKQPERRAEPTRQKPQTKEKAPEKEPTASPVVVSEPARLKGSRPDVPCVVSIEIKWSDKKDNVDLFVCKDNVCVYGAKRARDIIGYWDSGKSRTGLFGGDLRTNQEAVRQFDSIIPGTYQVYAQYKASSKPKPNIPVRLQVYTLNEDEVERGDNHYFKLEMNPNQRSRIAQVVIGRNGELEFQTYK